VCFIILIALRPQVGIKFDNYKGMNYEIEMTIFFRDNGIAADCLKRYFKGNITGKENLFL
jgi:hypothetical protein